MLKQKLWENPSLWKNKVLISDFSKLNIGVKKINVLSLL